MLLGCKLPIPEANRAAFWQSGRSHAKSSRPWQEWRLRWFLAGLTDEHTAFGEVVGNGAASVLMGKWSEPLRLTLNVSTRKKASLPVKETCHPILHGQQSSIA